MICKRLPSDGSKLSAVRSRAKTVAVIAHGEHVADVVPSGELERLRETIEVLSDRAALSDLADDSEPEVVGADSIRALVAERTARGSR
jgi:hypothetical protein